MFSGFSGMDANMLMTGGTNIAERGTFSENRWVRSTHVFPEEGVDRLGASSHPTQPDRGSDDGTSHIGSLIFNFARRYNHNIKTASWLAPPKTVL